MEISAVGSSRVSMDVTTHKHGDEESGNRPFVFQDGRYGNTVHLFFFDSTLFFSC